MVTGYAYEAELDVPMLAGDTGPALVGDYNGDGAVNAADYTIWRDTLNSTTDWRADGNGSMAIDAGDYAVWQSNYGTGGGSGAAVPEPGSIVMAVISGLTLWPPLVGGERQRR